MSDTIAPVVAVEETNYPTWKIVLWRGVRSFLVGFITTEGALLEVKPITVEDFQSFDTLKIYFIPLLIGGVVGAVNAFAKWLRLTFPDNVLLQKFPA